MVMGHHQAVLYALYVLAAISLTSSSAQDASPHALTHKPRLYLAEVIQGDPDATLKDVDTRYYVPDGECSGLLTVNDLGCEGAPPVTLLVRSADSVRAPFIMIHPKMNQVTLRRYNKAADACPGRLWVRLQSACESPSASSRREMDLHNHPKFQRAVFTEEDQVVSRRRRDEPLQLPTVRVTGDDDSRQRDVVALEEVEE